MDETSASKMKDSVRRFALRVLASWIAMMALDLLLNAGVFAKLWLEPSPFLLGPRDLFRRLPLGYAAFLLQASAYVWLAGQVGVKNWKQGIVFGLKFGTVLGVAAALGLRSGTTASWTLLLATWLVGGVVLTTGACFFAGLSSEHGENKALLTSFLFLIGAVIAIAILQSAGVVPVRRVG